MNLEGLTQEQIEQVKKLIESFEPKGVPRAVTKEPKEGERVWFGASNGETYSVEWECDRSGRNTLDFGNYFPDKQTAERYVKRRKAIQSMWQWFAEQGMEEGYYEIFWDYENGYADQQFNAAGRFNLELPAFAGNLDAQLFIGFNEQNLRIWAGVEVRGE